MNNKEETNLLIPSKNSCCEKCGKAEMYNVMHECMSKDQPEVSEWEKEFRRKFFYQSDGMSFPINSPETISLQKGFIKELINQTLEEAAEQISKEQDFDYSDGNELENTKLTNHRELGIKQGFRKAIIIIKSLKK